MRIAPYSPAWLTFRIRAIVVRSAAFAVSVGGKDVGLGAGRFTVSAPVSRLRLCLLHQLFHVNIPHPLPTYLPIQNRPKISPSTSSTPTAPVIRPTAWPALRRY